jgi:hypothetical protein
MCPSRCILLTHAIMGSGDKLHDEGLCGALWAGGGGKRYQRGAGMSVPHAAWVLETQITHGHVTRYNSVTNISRQGVK